MIRALWATPSAASPVPGPASRPGSNCSRAQPRAAADVLLAIPISPPMNSWAPFPCARSTASAPPCSAISRARGSIASLHLRLAVPLPALAETTPGKPVCSDAVPQSMISSTAPSSRARTLTAAPPATKLATICTVTAWGKAETPSSATP